MASEPGQKRSTDVRASKRELRRHVAVLIAGVTPEERAARSALICKNLLALPEWQQAQRVMLFVSLPDEVDTLPIVRAALATNKEVYLPKVTREHRRLLICRLRDLGELRPGTLGIPEPLADEMISPAHLDFVLVPGRAFDCHGNRLGRGGGYYDRFLADPSLRAAIFGVAFDCQILNRVPVRVGDVPVRFIITESGIIGRAVPARGLLSGDVLRKAEP